MDYSGDAHIRVLAAAPALAAAAADRRGRRRRQRDERPHPPWRHGRGPAIGARTSPSPTPSPLASTSDWPSCPAGLRLLTWRSADRYRRPQLANGYRAFLFSGHGDAELSGKETTLGFTGASGGLETVRAEHLAEMLGAHSPSHAGTLETVFLNGCATEQIGAQVHAAGVPYVVCWQTKAHTRAAHLLAATFFKSLASGRGHRKSFEDALSAVKLVTRPGKTASGIPSAVPAYELRDPLEPATNVSGFTPAPVAAGIPVLLCADRE